jgi:hypothetical protein
MLSGCLRDLQRRATAASVTDLVAAAEQYSGRSTAVTHSPPRSRANPAGPHRVTLAAEVLAKLEGDSILRLPDLRESAQHEWVVRDGTAAGNIGIGHSLRAGPSRVALVRDRT